MMKIKKLDLQLKWHSFWFMFWNTIADSCPCTKWAWHAIGKMLKHSHRIEAIHEEKFELTKPKYHLD